MIYCSFRPKHAIAAIKKKLYNPNPHCAMYALQVLESIVKNCGKYYSKLLEVNYLIG